MKSEKLAKELETVIENAGVKNDDYMSWGVYKLALGVMKIKWSLEENGVKGEEATEKLEKIVSEITKKDADKLHKIVHGDMEDWKK